MEQPIVKPVIKSGWLRVMLFTIPYFVIVAGFQLLAIAVISFFKGSSFQSIVNDASVLHQLDNFLVIELFLMLSSIMIIWLFMRFIDKKPIVAVGLTIKGKLGDLLLGILTGGVVMGIGVAVLMWMDLYKIANVDFVLSTFFSSIILCALISFSEEIVVRGYVLRNLLYSFPRYLALFISAILFASLHAFNPNLSGVGMMNLTLAGLLLGASYIYSKNLWFPIGLHFGWNFFQGPIFGFNVSGLNIQALIVTTPMEEQFWSGGSFGFEGSVLATILSLAALLFVIRYFKSKYDQRGLGDEI